VRRLGRLVNLVLRASIVYFLAEVLRKPNDPRFAGKAIPIRNLVIVGGLSLLFPSLYALRGLPALRSLGHRWKTGYPWWADNLHLSIYWFDMAGNSFNLYDRYTHFDLLPHAHGPGAAAVAARVGFGASRDVGIWSSNALHGALELQEILTDVFFGTHNIRGAWDCIGDMSAGVLGVIVYDWLYEKFWVRRGT